MTNDAVFVGVRFAPLGGGLAEEGDADFDPLFRRERKAVEPGLTFNCGEFAGIKIGIVKLLPSTARRRIGKSFLPSIGLMLGCRLEEFIKVGHWMKNDWLKNPDGSLCGWVRQYEMGGGVILKG